MLFDELGQEIGNGRRLAERHSLLIMADISRPEGSVLGQVKVRNLSSTGLLAETGIPFRVDEVVDIVLRGIGKVRGTVVRRTANKVAIRFELPVDPALVLRKR